MFWPIFRIAGSSRTGFSSGQRTLQRNLPRDQVGRAEKVTAALLVTKRDVAGAPRLDAKRDAHKLGPHLVQAGGFGVDGDMAALADQRDPAFKRRFVAHGFVAAVVEGLGGDVQHGGSIVGGGNGQPFGGRGVGHLQLSATRLVSVRNSIAFRKPISASGSGSFTSSASSAEVQRRVAVKLHEALRDADLLGVVRSGSGGASPA